MTRLIQAILGKSGCSTFDRAGSRGRDRRTAGFEALEPRKLLTDIQVTHLENWDFEAAVNFANNEPGADVITFAPELSGTITVSTRQWLMDAVTIRGNGKVSLSGGDTLPILLVSTGVTATIENLTLTHSSSEAIRVEGSVTLTNCTFDSNRAYFGGGGLYVSPTGSAYVSRCTFTGNSASRPNTNNGIGGAIANFGVLTVTDASFENNYSYKDGGAIYNDAAATLTVNRSTFSNNTADTGDGGAIRNLGSATVNNSTIAGNHAVVAGGLMGDMHVNFCTIAYNTGKHTAGGVMGQGNFIPNNTIIAKNTVNGAPAEIGSGSTNFWSHPFDIAGNLTGDIGTSDGIPNSFGNWVGYDPKFLTATPVDNCGFTKTIAIAADSPAKDSAFNSNIGTDQRGFTRFGQGLGLDIGAFERQYYGGILSVGTTADAVDGNYSEGNLSLREAINIGLQSDIGATISLAVPAGSTITLTAGPLQIAGNTSINGGGADKVTIDGAGQTNVLVINGGTHSLEGFTIANGTNSSGAAISGSISALTLTSMAFTGNSCFGVGGAISVSGGSLAIAGSTFFGNTAAAGGGAVFVDSTNLQVTNSTFSGNHAAYGSAISGEYGTISINNSTIAYNTSNNPFGGAIYSTQSPVLMSTIVAQNTNGDLGVNAASDSANNLIGDSAAAGGLTNGQQGNIVGADPKLGPLGHNGGSTKTHRLLGGSPAIGTGSNPLNLTYDQRGDPFLRARFGNPDTGAFEAVLPKIASFTAASSTFIAGHPVTLTASGVVDEDGSIQSVEFYRDINGDEVPDSGEYFGNDLSASGGYTFDFNPAGLPGGPLTLIAVAYDNDGHKGLATLSVSITAPTAQTYTVSTTEDMDDGNFADGQLSLREAVRLSDENSGLIDTISFAPGLNGKTITLSFGEVFVMDSVIITGPGRSLLTIDGNQMSRIFSINDTGTTATISGLSLVRGYDGGDGGGILSRGTLTLDDMLIGSCFAGHSGGGIYCEKTLTLNNSLLTDNAATHAGGAVEHTGFMFMDRTTIDSNAASDAGGISVNGGNLTMTNSLVVGNGLTDAGNSVGGGGGIAIWNGGAVEITCSTIADNTATLALGGGIFNKDGWLHLKHSTVAGNHAIGSSGGGIDTESGASTRLDSTIVAGNQGGDIHGPINVHSSYNLIQDSAPVTGITNGVDGNIVGVDPKLGALADNGGPTKTMALLAHSPAIGKAINPLQLATDQRGAGFARTKGGRTDIGAFESEFVAAGNDLLGASAGASGNINIAGRDSGEHPLIFQQQPGQSSTWTKIDLQAKSGSPAITGEIVTWVDPKDGRNYAAGMSADGLILFTNTSGNSWTFRNLSTEVTGFPAITGNLTTFTSTDNRVSIAGVAASGDLVRYVQSGAGASGSYAWNAINHGDDLRAQGLTVPQFTGRVTSFVTPWNALNVIGLDVQGNIQAIWWHESLSTGGKWTTNNLSQEYSAPALTGGLTVWLTSWSAINIAGTDTSGKLSTTWWVPGYNNNAWNTNNLTDDIGGPLLQPDSMCSWVTPWGAMNVAGRESDGTTSVYWWVPNYNGNMWQVEQFRDSLPGATATVGPVSGITALAGDKSMSILSTTADGDVVRLWWQPSTNAWAEQNLTQIAVPA